MSTEDKKRIEEIRHWATWIAPNKQGNRDEVLFLLAQIDKAHEALRRISELSAPEDDWTLPACEMKEIAREALGEE